MISAVIVNFNEAEKLNKCLRSLQDFAEELVVIDIGSTDNSEEVYNKYGVKVFKRKFVSFVEQVRNFAVSKASGAWVLVLDPDEIIGDALKNKLKSVILEDQYQAVNIPRKNIFFGKWIAHTNWWPDKHVRFFKKGTVVWSEEIHRYPQVSGKVLSLEAKENLAIEHFGYRSVSEFLTRQNRYSSIEAENLFSAKIKFSWFNFFWFPSKEFLIRFIKHAGFLDGFYGFALTLLMMVYKFQVLVKLWELEQKR